MWRCRHGRGKKVTGASLLLTWHLKMIKMASRPYGNSTRPKNSAVNIARLLKGQHTFNNFHGSITRFYVILLQLKVELRRWSGRRTTTHLNWSKSSVDSLSHSLMHFQQVNQFAPSTASCFLCLLSLIRVRLIMWYKVFTRLHKGHAAVTCYAGYLNGAVFQQTKGRVSPGNNCAVKVKIHNSRSRI